jgi:ATP-dependent Clp protease ATP-binding subunit ClpA
LKSQPGEAAAPSFIVRPLFLGAPVTRSDNLNRAITKLATALRHECDRAGQELRHESLAAFSFSPPLEDHFLRLDLDLPGGRTRCSFLFVVVEKFGRNVAFTPSIPELWFEVRRGHTLRDRATEVLSRYFRDKEKEDGPSAPEPERLSVPGKAWVGSVEVDVYPPKLAPSRSDRLLALIGAPPVLNGALELDRVGRPLDVLYPDELNRASGRDKEVAELGRLLTTPDRRSVLIVGPRLVGKTAIIHEHVFRTLEKRKSGHSREGKIWLLSPQRLVSGMSYVGQWENRLLAIMKEARVRGHILYFDDLLGLYEAGQSSNSTLSMADILKPAVEKREVRVLAEMTPEAFRALQERDRGFADLFHIMRLAEPDEDSTYRMLLSLLRETENKNKCQFSVEVLPAAVELHRRYVRDAAFPGKAATFLDQLAVKYRGLGITRMSALSEFKHKTGLSVAFVDPNQSLDRQEIVDAIGGKVIGQPAAVEACADAIMIAKARLNDTSRPLASFLFMGPTGVGKTECAKALASYLFGSEERLIRLDMNEYVSGASASRLVGSLGQPEGLLTSSVRREPFSVVLLDEIEKAHPDVFNILLQVMGDARLTDSLGRTADFGNTFLIMTSNLGVREASSAIGFAADAFSEAGVYVQAAEKFFRPEFFNRIDRIIPFRTLARDDVQDIADRLISDILKREGFVRRRCMVSIDSRAMERIIDYGYDPELGARALKRTLERQVARVSAQRLSATRLNAPAIINITEHDGELSVDVGELVAALPNRMALEVVRAGDPEELLRRIGQSIDRVENAISHLAPSGPISTEAIGPEQYSYFQLKEHLARIHGLWRRTLDRVKAAKTATTKSRTKGRSLPTTRMLLRHSWETDLWVALVASENPYDVFREIALNLPGYGEQTEHYLADLIRETSLLELLADEQAMSSPERILVHVKSIVPRFQPDTSSAIGKRLIDKALHEKPTLDSRQREKGLSDTYADLLREHFGYSADAVPCEQGSAFAVTGPAVGRLMETEAGTQLVFSDSGSLAPMIVQVLPMAQDDDPVSAALKLGIAPVNSDARSSEPFKIPPVVRIHFERDAGGAADLRSGLITPRSPTLSEMRAFLLAALPLPLELRA